MKTPRIRTGERGRFVLLAFLFFINSLVLESNEVVATSGFVSNVGVSKILLVWSVVMITVILASGTYSLFIDRFDRVRFAIVLFMLFSLIYLGFYFMFSAGVSDFISYGLLAVFTEQQWMLFPLLIWALANDMFSIADAKRLFPLLAVPAIVGGVLGNSVAAVVGQMTGGQAHSLLVFNSALIMVATITLFINSTKIEGQSRTVDAEAGMRAVVREGMTFIREVPSFRYLTITLILMGIALNTIEYQFLLDVAEYFTDPGKLQAFYGAFKVASAGGLILLQAGVATWLMNRAGFKHIFMFMPTVLMLSLVLTFFWLSPAGASVLLTGAIVGDYFSRVTLTGIDEPARRTYEGFIPDQTRGRVSAFLDGILYPLGSLVGCGMIGIVLYAVGNGWLTDAAGRMVYIGVAIGCAFAGVIAMTRFRVTYDASSFNWRLKRRKRGKSILDEIEF